MTILEILQNQLCGKHIMLEKYLFQNPSFLETYTRYFLPEHYVLKSVKKDKNFKYIGTQKIPIVAVTGEFDDHEGDSLYIHILDDEKEYVLCISMIDKLTIV
jgi:hypothetical protein